MLIPGLFATLMGDSRAVSFVNKSVKRLSREEEEEPTAEGDSISSSQKQGIEHSIRRSSRKSVTKEVKTFDNEVSVSTSEEKEKMKGQFEGRFEPLETQKQNEPRRKDKLKSFASKGAAAKSVLETGVDNTAKETPQELKRREASSAIHSVIRPTAEQTKVQPPQSPSTAASQPPLREKSHKREVEIMHEELLKNEKEDQALATFVLDLVKKKRKEKEEAAEIVLTDDEIFKRSKNMSALEQAGIISVLEEAIAKLSVLGYTHGKPVVKQEIKYVSLLDKLAEKEESSLIGFIKSNKSPEEYENEQHFIKLQKDRGFLEEALTLTLLEMRKKGTFKILQDIVHLEEAMRKEEEDLRFDAKNRQQEVNHCKALLENERRRGMKKLDDRTAILAKLKDEIQNVLYYNGLKFKYMDHWESSRAEQNAMMLQNKEKELDRQFMEYEEMRNIEMRCSAEMKAFIEENIKKLTDKVEEWMEKHDTELEEREYKLNKLKEERAEHLKKLKDKMDLFNERQRQIDEWKAYKEKKRLEAEYKAKLNRMATRIQAWWRGTMVRRHLGPYKKKRGKHGKKGKRKKKK